MTNKLNPTQKSSFWLRDLAFLTLIIGFLYGAMLGSFPLQSPDGARYAEIPREMVVNGDYLTPHLNGIKYFEKPPLFYWLQAGAIKTFGLSEWAVNAVNGLFALLTCLFLYVAGRKLYDRRTGILASLTLATCTLFFVLGRIITLDMALTAFLSMGLLNFLLGNNFTGSKKHSHNSVAASFSLCSGYCLFTKLGSDLWRRLKTCGYESLINKQSRQTCGYESISNKQVRTCNWHFLLFYIFIALAVMTKGLVGALLPGLIIFFWVAFFNKWSELKSYCLVTGILLFLLIAAPWHILVQLKNPEFFHFYFVEQHFLRYLTPYAGRQQPFWFFFVVFIAGFFPWVIFLPATIKKYWVQRWIDRHHYQKEFFLSLWATLIFFFYNFSDSKLITYILPVFPPLALLVGKYLADVWKRADADRNFSLGLKIFCLLALMLGLGVLIAIHFLNFQDYPFTALNLYLIASSLIIAGLLTYFFYHKYGAKAGLIVLIITQAFFLLSLAPCISIGNGKSIKPLALILQAKLQPGDEVASYQDYYQDLPYYLRQKITVVDFKGELEFGTQHADTTTWMINEKTFWQRWSGKKRMFMVVDKDSYAAIVKEAKAGSAKLYLLGQHLDTMLFANFSL